MSDSEEVSGTPVPAPIAGNPERLEAARKAAGFKSARAASAAFGWPESTYRSHENGTRRFDEEDAKRYASAFGVPPEWLHDGYEVRQTVPRLATRDQSTAEMYQLPNGMAQIRIDKVVSWDAALKILALLEPRDP